MEKKKFLLFASLLVSTLALGTITILSNGVNDEYNAGNDSPFGLVFSKDSNKLSTYKSPDKWETKILEKDAKLLSKVNSVTMEASYLKSIDDGWQIFKKDQGYFKNLDHIIGMDKIVINAKPALTESVLEIHYSGSPLTDENSYKAKVMPFKAKANEALKIDFNFLDLKPNYFKVVAKSDIEIIDCQIQINKSCSDFYKNVKVNVNKGYMANIKGDGKNLMNHSVTVEALPNEGFEFVSWSDNKGKILSKTNPYTFMMPDNDIEIYCNLRKEQLATNIKSFGLYPQSKVIESDLLYSLNTVAGELPTETALNGWTSYKFYQKESNIKDYAWYKDIEYAGFKYRGVYYTSYRPMLLSGDGTAASSNQDNLGYLVNEVHWFLFEEIDWKVLNKEGLLMAYPVLDTYQFYLNGQNYKENGTLYYPNDYTRSHVRSWLELSFIRWAFTDEEINRIKPTTIKNDAKSTGFNDNKYSYADTVDLVFLLSAADLANPDLGFNNNDDRAGKCSDYANCMGLRSYAAGFNSRYLTRSSSPERSSYVSVVDDLGILRGFSVNNITNTGIRPAMYLN